MRLLALLFCSLFLGAAFAAPEKLPALGVSNVTVSGLSSGAFMAMQFQVAHSQSVQGAGIIAGGPFYCAEGSPLRAIQNCMAGDKFSPPDAKNQREHLLRAEAAGEIDPLSYLKKRKIWLFSGKNDTIVHPNVMAALHDFYAEFLENPALQLVFVKHPDAAHALIEPNAPATNECSAEKSPYLNRCGNDDTPYDLLTHLLGDLQAASETPQGNLIAFDQSEFTAKNPAADSLASTGFIYIPKSCENGGCRLHIAFHGCKQNTDAVGDAFIRHGGYNRWADNNQLILLYPQTVARFGFSFSAGNVVINPNACWDWWGYTGKNYASREAPQIKAVKAMMDRLAKPRLP